MPKLLYIASLPHSGSTLLNLLLGKSPGLIGISGIDRAMKMLVDEKDREKTAGMPCSCGASVRECVYWGKVLQALEGGERPTNLAQRYQLALSVFEDVFGPDVWPVDASKIKEPLYALAGQNLFPLDLRVIHLSKDYRSAITSMIDLKRRKGGNRRPGPLLAVEGGWRWWWENRKIDRCLRQTALPTLRVGYEELCLGFANTLGRICEFAGSEPARDLTPEIHTTQSHLFIGNRMRRQEEKATLLYDYRWLTRREWFAAALFWPHLHHCNTRWVYSAHSTRVFEK